MSILWGQRALSQHLSQETVKLQNLSRFGKSCLGYAISTSHYVSSFQVLIPVFLNWVKGYI